MATTLPATSNGQPLLNPATGHYYDFVVTPPGTSWSNAKTMAESQTYLTSDSTQLIGYLATITSEEEELFLRNTFGGNLRNIWLGGSDAGIEGEWRWVTGPEGAEDGGAGLPFWIGGRSGTPLGYTNWNGGEPNNHGDEDYLGSNPDIDAPNSQFGWNDYLHQPFPERDKDAISGYFVEFGDEIPIVTDIDFDLNGSVDTNDTDALVAAIISGENNPAFDLNLDELVNGSDLTQWLSFAAIKNGFTTPYLLGDANLDGAVNAADLNNLGQNWLGSPKAWRWGDFNADGIVNASDLNQLGQNWHSVSIIPIPGVEVVSLRVDSDSHVQDFDEALGDNGRETGTRFPLGWTVVENETEVDTVLLPFPIGIVVPGGTATFNAGPIGDTDRALALGVRDDHDELSIELLAQNTGGPADSFQLEFDIEAWDAADGLRSGDNVIRPAADIPGEAAFKVTVDIVSSDEFTSFVDLGTVTTGPVLQPVPSGIVDGNADPNRVEFDSGIVSTSIPAGSVLRFRWTPDFDAPTSGWVFGIDNVSLSLFADGAAVAVPEPTAATLALFALAAMMWRRR